MLFCVKLGEVVTSTCVLFDRAYGAVGAPQRCLAATSDAPSHETVGGLTALLRAWHLDGSDCPSTDTRLTLRR